MKCAYGYPTSQIKLCPVSYADLTVTMDTNGDRLQAHTHKTYTRNYYVIAE